MTALDFTLPLGLGFLSSLHCAQMCGPIVLCVGPAARDHLSYNGGRILTYAALGAIAGAAGRGMVELAGVEQIAAIAAGGLMIVAGLLMAGAAPRRALVRIERWRLPRLFSRAIGRMLLAPGTMRRFALGGLMGFLPCGLLYAALLKAAATGSAAQGAISMLAFGLGTASSLLAIGLFSTVVRAGLGRWSGALAAISVTAMGAFLVWRGVMAQIPRSCHAGM